MSFLRLVFFVSMGLSVAASPAWSTMGASPFEERRIGIDTVVVDSRTGLTWQKTSGQNKTWRDALAYCENSVYAGYADWRLPQDQELMSLVSYSTSRPASDFPGMLPQRFWTSVTYADVGAYDHAWSVKFETGEVLFTPKTALLRARCVR